MSYRWDSAERRFIHAGRVYFVVTVVEQDVGTDNQWGPVTVPNVCTITLFEAVGSGGTVGLLPELGTTADFNATTLDLIDRASQRAPLIRMSVDLRLIAPYRTLYGRSRPAGDVTMVTTRITYAAGHPS